MWWSYGGMSLWSYGMEVQWPYSVGRRQVMQYDSSSIVTELSKSYSCSMEDALRDVGDGWCTDRGGMPSYATEIINIPNKNGD